MREVAKYPVGKFILCGGMAAAIGTAFNAFGAGYVQQRFGDVAMISIQFVGAAVLILLTIDVYRKMSPRVAITAGICGWLATFAISFYFFSHLM